MHTANLRSESIGIHMHQTHLVPVHESHTLRVHVPIHKRKYMVTLSRREALVLTLHRRDRWGRAHSRTQSPFGVHRSWARRWQ